MLYQLSYKQKTNDAENRTLINGLKDRCFTFKLHQKTKETTKGIEPLPTDYEPVELPLFDVALNK